MTLGRYRVISHLPGAAKLPRVKVFCLEFARLTPWQKNSSPIALVMKKQTLTVLATILLSAGSAGAQSKLQMVLNGTCYTKDAQGHIVARAINNQTLLLQAAQAGGSTGTTGLALAYHIGGNSL